MEGISGFIRENQSYPCHPCSNPVSQAAKTFLKALEY